MEKDLLVLDLAESEMPCHFFFIRNLRVSSGEIMKSNLVKRVKMFVVLFFFNICASFRDLPSFEKIKLELRLVEELVCLVFFFPVSGARSLQRSL